MKKWYMRKLVIGLLMSVFLLGGLTLSPVLASPLVAEFNCAGQSSIPVDQCKALVAIYEATGGENWINNTGWLQEADPCQWYGVSCSDGNVVALDVFGNNLTGTLPLEIGGFPNLKTLTINGNPISGPIPLTITFMDLDLFHFHNTSLCEPDDPAFQDWFLQIVYRLSSGIECPSSKPTATLFPLQTQDVSDLPWPQQTLTALAGGSGFPLGAVTPEPSPTKYYVLSPTPTSTPEGLPAVEGETSGMEEPVEKDVPAEEPAGFLSDIPRGWLIVLMVPVVLIVIGILLELRDRKKEAESKKSSPLEYGDIETRL